MCAHVIVYMRSRSCIVGKSRGKESEGGKGVRDARCERSTDLRYGDNDGREAEGGGRCGGRCRTDRVTVWVNHTPPLVHKYAAYCTIFTTSRYTCAPLSHPRVSFPPPPSVSSCSCATRSNTRARERRDRRVRREDGQAKKKKRKGARGRRDCWSPVEGSTGVNASRIHTRAICGTRTAEEGGRDRK